MTRRLRGSTTAVPLLVIGLVLAGLGVAQARRRDHQPTTAHSTTASSTTASSTTATATPHRSTKHSSGRVDPLNTAALRRYIDSRRGDVTVAVDNLRTGRTYVWNPGERAQTGSIIKADILETLLHQAMVSHTPLSEATEDVVQGMIEDSDNDDANELWNQVGGASAISAYDQLAGLTQTALTPRDIGARRRPRLSTRSSCSGSSSTSMVCSTRLLSATSWG